MVSGFARSNSCIVSMDRPQVNRVRAHQKKEVILPEIVPLKAGKRAINFGLQDRTARQPYEGMKIRRERLGWGDESRVSSGGPGCGPVRTPGSLPVHLSAQQIHQAVVRADLLS